MAQRIEGKRAKVRGTFVEHVLKDILWARYDGMCGICKEPVPWNNFEVDHIIPVSRGGTHSYENCWPAHSLCNRAKANSMPKETYHLPVKRRKEKYHNKNGMANGKRAG